MAKKKKPKKTKNIVTKEGGYGIGIPVSSASTSPSYPQGNQTPQSIVQTQVAGGMHWPAPTAWYQQGKESTRKAILEYVNGAVQIQNEEDSTRKLELTGKMNGAIQSIIQGIAIATEAAELQSQRRRSGDQAATFELSLTEDSLKRLLKILWIHNFVAKRGMYPGLEIKLMEAQLTGRINRTTTITTNDDGLPVEVDKGEDVNQLWMTDYTPPDPGQQGPPLPTSQGAPPPPGATQQTTPPNPMEAPAQSGQDNAPVATDPPQEPVATPQDTGEAMPAEAPPAEEGEAMEEQAPEGQEPPPQEGFPYEEAIQAMEQQVPEETPEEPEEQQEPITSREEALAQREAALSQRELLLAQREAALSGESEEESEDYEEELPEEEDTEQEDMEGEEIPDEEDVPEEETPEEPDEGESDTEEESDTQYCELCDMEVDDEDIAECDNPNCPFKSQEDEVPVPQDEETEEETEEPVPKGVMVMFDTDDHDKHKTHMIEFKSYTGVQGHFCIDCNKLISCEFDNTWEQDQIKPWVQKEIKTQKTAEQLVTDTIDTFTDEEILQFIEEKKAELNSHTFLDDLDDQEIENIIQQQAGKQFTAINKKLNNLPVH